MVAALVICGGCPDEPQGNAESGSTSGGGSTTATTTMSSADTSGTTTVSSSTTVGTSEGSSTVTTTESTTTATDGSSSGGSTTGGDFCTIDLPPGPACPAQAPRGSASVRSGAAAGPADEDDLVGGYGGGGFIQDPDGGTPVQCSTFEQDCPDGEKCTPWANDGGSSWNATHCTPVDPAPVAIGQACMVEGNGVSGVDNCGVGAMCWDVDNQTNMGVCVELCSCSELTPVCETDNTACLITNDGVLALCLPVCNPLDPGACADGDGCFPVDDLFHCAPVAGGGAPGDECQYINACDPGTFCAAAGSVPGCGGVGCCSSFCDLAQPANGCLAGQDCLPWYAEGQEPDACLGSVGACAAG
ncbi:MAG: hypothetical protein K1X88_22870 [Nannocystaceae bacterium]|nr:hypothetical protein [Nannocystaceae bacterium]